MTPIVMTAALPLVECKVDVLAAALDAFGAFGGITGLFVGFVALVTMFSQPPDYAEVMAERINSSIAVGSIIGGFTGLAVFVVGVASL